MSIHIKKKNKGKFTESAKKAGHSVQEHAKAVLNDPDATPLQKKRANFAKNAAKWKHEDGGSLGFAGSLLTDSETQPFGSILQIKGRKHENGGTLLDTDGDGIANLEAEDGEAIKNNFIVSDNIGYDKNGNLTDKKNEVVKTFADKSKKIERKYSNRPEYDHIANNTKEIEHNKVISDNQFLLDNIDAKKGNLPKAGNGANILEFLNTLGSNGAFTQNPLQSITGIIGGNIPAPAASAGAGASAVAGLGKGMAAGAALGPLGMLGGAAIGGIIGAVQGGKNREEYLQQRRETARFNSQDDINKGADSYNTFGQFKNGGPMYKRGGKFLPKADAGQSLVRLEPESRIYNFADNYADVSSSQASPFTSSPITGDFSKVPQLSVPKPNSDVPEYPKALFGTIGDKTQLLGQLPATLYNMGMAGKKAAKEPYAFNSNESAITRIMAGRRFNEQPLVNEANLAFNAGAKALNENTSSDAVNRAGKIALFTGLGEKTQLARLQGQQMNNQYRGEEASTLNQLGMQKSAEKARVSDINARNLAAKQAFGAKAATQVGQGLTETGKVQNQSLNNQMLYKTLNSLYSKYKLNGQSFDDFLKTIMSEDEIIQFKKNG